jgi:RNA polymerase sigma-70 factor (ECF subfamily)
MAKAVQRDANFSEVALSYLDGLYGYAISLCHNPAEAADLTQETYLRAVRAFGQLAPDSNLKSWLFTIMRRVWLNQIRHAHCGPQFVDIDDEQCKKGFAEAKSADDPHTYYVHKMNRESVRTAVENLSPQHREVIVLSAFEGLSYQEIAGVLQCPAGTVMSGLSRAREKLREFLTPRKPAPLPLRVE